MRSAVVVPAPSPYATLPSSNQSKTHSTSHLPSSNLKLRPLRYSHRTSLLLCKSSSGPSGDSESKNILDAFFLGKALAEAVNERLESAVGEFLSTVGRLQAEQQKQVLEFQEDVIERARIAKERAAREAMEAREPVPSSTVVDSTPVNTVSASTAEADPPVNSSPSSDTIRPRASAVTGPDSTSDEE